MAISVKKKTTWQKLRKLFNDIHLWLGLTSGIVVLVVCFSGTVYVFNTELTEKAASHLYKVEVPAHAAKLSPDSLWHIVQDANPNADITSMTVAAKPDRSYRYVVKSREDKNSRGVTHLVNPYTGAILGNSNEKNGTKEFMSTMFSLHRWLLLDKVEKPIIKGTANKELGSMITGWATILFTLGCITGLVIWFPQKIRTWKQGLKIKWRASWKRLNHDLHNTLAFYALFFLLLMGLTGPQWSFDWYRTGLQKTLGTYKGKSPQLEKKSETTKEKSDSRLVMLSLSDLLQASDKVLAFTGDYTITLPTEGANTVAISKNKLGFFAPAAADRLTLEASSGKIIKKDIFKEKPFNERVAGSIKALHVGNVYGLFTKIIYFIACLIATTLPVTGTLIWLNKLKQKRRKSSKKKVTQVAPPTIVV